ncbi:MAG: PH domain-containing protein [Candidatus Altiarchaeota archaeon]|nr:PH domain-containing protein [Candidatus Altiarchaeota archaeon]
MLKKFLSGIKSFLDEHTDLDSEDLMPGEQIIFSSMRAVYSEGILLAALLGLVTVFFSAVLIAYAFIANVGGIWGNILVGGALVCLFSGIIFSVNSILGFYSVRYFLTNFRVVKRTGIFTKKIIYVPYSRIQNVKLSKNLSERLIDMGDIYLDVAGGDQVEMMIDDIPDPEKMHGIILEKMGEKENGQGI